MRYADFKNAIINSDIDEWIYDDELGKYVFLDNIRLSIVAERDYTTNNSFYENWVERYPNSNATRSRFFLQYNGEIIEIFYTVSVDGGRNYIPYPNRQSMTITREQYNIGKIINKLNIEVGYSFDDYLATGGITIED